MEKMQLLAVGLLVLQLQILHGYLKVRIHFIELLYVTQCLTGLEKIEHFSCIVLDGKVVDQTHRRAQVLEFGDLLIPAIRSSDAGRYTCIRANEAGKVEASAWLSVLGKHQVYSVMYASK
jgi:hypothetical protein